jgi:rare lipoprotein A
MPDRHDSAKTNESQIVLYLLHQNPCGGPVRSRTAAVALLLAAVSLISACHKKTKPQVAMVPRAGATDTGLASWYGYPYHGRRAANGEIYDMEKLTAAHRTLPFDTWVAVRNLSNDKSVTVRITDRGPFVDGRIIDLSKAAAREIDMIGPGVTRVQLTIVAPPPDREIPPVSLFAVQIGAFRDRNHAESLRAEYEQQFGAARVVYRAGDPALWRVLVGRETSMDAANQLLARILSRTEPAFVVRLDEGSGVNGAGQHD